MLFKDYMTNIWQPMQLQARARGMNPADVDMGPSMRKHLAPKLLDQTRTDVRKEGLNLAHRGLDLESRRLGTQYGQFKQAKRLAPWATGLGVANVGLTIAGGLGEMKQSEQDRQLMRKYMSDYRGIR